jgi:hypothetical protein
LGELWKSVNLLKTQTLPLESTTYRDGVTEENV